MAQYPIRKVRLVRTIKNILPDGSTILSPDAAAARLVWQFAYADLSTDEMNALRDHFAACAGPLRGFTFIDPTDNMLISSSDLTATVWQTPSSIRLTENVPDPEQGNAAVIAENTGQSEEEISQTLAVPANYQYCFSAYAMSSSPASITLIRRGSSGEQSASFAAGSAWNRLVSSGRLDDAGGTFTVAIRLAAGQQVVLYGLQLEAQIAPSRYRPTTGTGGVYAKAHWAADQLITAAEAPNLFSASFSIETSL